MKPSEIASIEDIQMELWLRKRNNGDLQWTTKDGTRIPIKDLSDRHLENILKMANRDSISDDVYYFDPFYDLD